MSDAYERADAFLLENGLHADGYDFAQEVERFRAEMRRGLRGEASSLRMLPTYVDVSAPYPPAGDVLAIDVGGTNLRVALVRFRAGRPPEIVSKDKCPVPGSQEAVTLEGFFDRIVGFAKPLWEASATVGLCFSFPHESLPDLDARILCINKELRVGGAEGRRVVHALNDAFGRVGVPAKRVAVLNDSSAALLGELAVQEGKDYGGYIGLIYGTGLNFCYSERTADIVKLGGDAGQMLVNTEAGGYAGFRQSVCDRAVDEASAVPGAYAFEKMASGAYFGTMALHVLKHAAAQGLFSPEASHRIASTPDLTAAEVTTFLNRQKGTFLFLSLSESDDAVARALLDGLYGRAAKLVAIAVTAAMLESGGGSADTPIFLSCEGSSFRMGFHFRERFEAAIRKGAGGSVFYDLILAENHTLIGAAVAAMMAPQAT